MNKSELVEALAERLGDKKVATQALDDLVDIISRRVAKGERVSITGFGSFSKVERGARTARNPQTGEKVKVKKSSAPKFKPGAVFKSTTNGTTKMGREPKPTPILPAGVTTLAAVKEALNAPTKKTPAKAPAKSTAAKPEVKKAAPAKKSAAKKSASSVATKAAPAKKTAAVAKRATKKTTKPAPAKKTTKATAKKTATKKAAAKK